MSGMAAAREDTRGIRRGRTKERLPLAMQIQIEPRRAQGCAQETLWHFLCETLCPLWLSFFCEAAARVLRFFFVASLRERLRRVLPVQQATGVARRDGVSQRKDR